MRRLAPFWVLVLVLGPAACSKAPPSTTTQMNAVVASPTQLAYLCVTPGCQETETVEIDIQGTRRVAIKRVLLSGSGSTDFTFTPSEMPPFIVGAGSDFTVDVTYVPLGRRRPVTRSCSSRTPTRRPTRAPIACRPGSSIFRWCAASSESPCSP